MSSCKNCHVSKNSSTILTGSDCGIDNNTAGNCALDEYGYPIVTQAPNNSGCVTGPDGTLVCPNTDVCTYWDMTKTNDACVVVSYIEEQLNISGAVLNVYKMLGVQEQQKLTDILGNGNAISSGDMPNFPAQQAFVGNLNTEWRSAVTGTAVIGKSFLGYDFGNIKMPNGREKYGIETAVKHDVCTIKIQQGCNSANRVTKARLERSDDGQVWFGVSILNIPDCDGLVTLSARKTVPARYWRLRPMTFNGGTNDYWVVVALQLSPFEKTDISNIEDRILLENRDRDYQTAPITMKCMYTPIDVQANASKWGFFQTDVYSIQVSFAQTIAMLGRPFAIGDLIELPSEQFYSMHNNAIKKYLMINDVAWYTGGYTQSWTPTMLRLIAVPAVASQETQQVTGKLTQDEDSTGLADINNGHAKTYQDISNISKTIKARANDLVPERGEDTTVLTQFTPEAYAFAKEKNLKFMKDLKTRASVIGHDAMPPNGKPFTEGDEFPINPASGDYHRLTYQKYGDDIPPRLYRYSTRADNGSGGWIPVDVDRRFEFKKTRPIVQEFLDRDNINLDGGLT
jgi:hypothetical protein